VGKNPDITAVKKIEQATIRCEGLSILPAVVSRFLAQITRMELTPATLAELIESDPALTVLALRLYNDKAKNTRQGEPWIQQLISTVTLREIRDAVLSAKLCGGLEEDARTKFRRELTRHSLAVGCCAERLAQLVNPPMDGATAYLAGLLHDIGKFVLDEVMPKSFDTLLEQARSEKRGFCDVERENLGIDHTITGKRFAQKMRLPADVILGIWLHHSRTGAVAEAVPQARIAGIVELSDMIVRKAGLGDSGSYDEVSPETIADSLGLTAEQIEQVEEELPQQVMQKSEAAGLTLLRPGWAYCDALKGLSGQLATENEKLFDESTNLQAGASNFDFVKELFAKIDSTISPDETAQQIGIVWQRFFQTGPVCVYLVGSNNVKTIEGAVIENQTSAKTIFFEVPEDADLIPQAISGNFDVAEASDYVDWLLEQTEVAIDISRTKIAPLQSGGKTVGVIIFEMRHPVAGDIRRRFAPAASFSGVFLDMAATISSQQWLAERFAQLLTERPTSNIERPTSNIEQRTQKTDIEGLAEMAAGAAHEMNNPLSVIKGRAQLLAGTETDAEKKRILEQIEQNAEELTAIIDDLMSYARPAKPKPSEMTVRQIIDEAIDLAGMKTAINRGDIKIEVSPDTPNVFIDSAQIDISLSNIICNALESYDGQAGPLTIKVSGEKTKSAAVIAVSDSGRGMDAETLAKATQPFFSAKPAGRKRGMGLSHSQRLIKENGGDLAIASQPGKGTTVTVTLPTKI
jgi:putative nucleotidyltransferase with HDIG domain